MSGVVDVGPSRRVVGFLVRECYFGNPGVGGKPLKVGWSISSEPLRAGEIPWKIILGKLVNSFKRQMSSYHLLKTINRGTQNQIIFFFFEILREADVIMSKFLTNLDRSNYGYNEKAIVRENASLFYLAFIQKIFYAGI